MKTLTLALAFLCFSVFAQVEDKDIQLPLQKFTVTATIPRAHKLDFDNTNNYVTEVSLQRKGSLYSESKLLRGQTNVKVGSLNQLIFDESFYFPQKLLKDYQLVLRVYESDPAIFYYPDIGDLNKDEYIVYGTAIDLDKIQDSYIFDSELDEFISYNEDIKIVVNSKVNTDSNATVIRNIRKQHDNVKGIQFFCSQLRFHKLLYSEADLYEQDILGSTRGLIMPETRERKLFGNVRLSTYVYRYLINLADVIGIDNPDFQTNIYSKPFFKKNFFCSFYRNF
ncbi:MAG: hypothetical protein H6621_13100 [Halobacteriovoraceae bacterium]|nr:hypothetical protein [Halobacteriovoraceae bacterium]